MDEDVRLLLSLTGVGIYTALLIKSEIGDIHRFPSYKKLISWAGLAPSLYQSGSVEYHGRITRQGSRMLRWIMVEAARVAVRHDPRMRAFYEGVARRRGDGKAIVAVACKMLKIVWFMLTRREPYESRDGRLYGAKLATNARMHAFWPLHPKARSANDRLRGCLADFWVLVSGLFGHACMHAPSSVAFD